MKVIEKLVSSLLVDGISTVFFKDESSFFKGFFKGSRHLLYIILQEPSAARMLRVKNILKERTPNDTILVPSFDQMRQIIETYKVPNDMIFINVWSVNQLNMFLNSTDFIIQMNKLIIGGNQFGQKYPNWKTRRVTPWDLIFSWDEGILSYEQILLDLIMNKQTVTPELCEYICISVIRNVLMTDNIFPDSANIALDEFSRHWLWRDKSIHQKISVAFRSAAGAVEFLVQIRNNLFPIKTISFWRNHIE